MLSKTEQKCSKEVFFYSTNFLKNTSLLVNMAEFVAHVIKVTAGRSCKVCGLLAVHRVMAIRVHGFDVSFWLFQLVFVAVYTKFVTTRTKFVTIRTKFVTIRVNLHGVRAIPDVAATR